MLNSRKYVYFFKIRENNEVLFSSSVRKPRAPATAYITLGNPRTPQTKKSEGVSHAWLWGFLLVSLWLLRVVLSPQVVWLSVCLSVCVWSV